MNRQFPALSGLAIVLMVLNHSITLTLQAGQRLGYAPPVGLIGAILVVLRDLGVFAVPTFLFVAGAFVAYAARGDPPGLSRSFVLRSVAHILWPYLIWSVIFYALVYAHYGERYGVMGYAKNLLTGYPYHFVPLLLISYLVSPLLVIAARRRGLLLLAVIGILQLLLIGILHKGSLGFVFPAQAHALMLPIIGGTLSEWAIYFPLGLIYGMHARAWLPVLKRLRFVLVGATVVLFVLATLYFSAGRGFELGKYLCPVPFVLLLPLIQRQSIPLVRQFEAVGKHSYGVYLTHLLVLDLTLWAIAAAVPGALNYPILVAPVVVALGLTVPLTVMNWAARLPTRRVYRYVFG